MKKNNYVQATPHINERKPKSYQSLVSKDGYNPVKLEGQFNYIPTKCLNKGFDLNIVEFI